MSGSLRSRGDGGGGGSRGAFTLIELLVVVGIISILLAILLPTISRARAVARRTECAARLHELTAACAMYLDEHKVYPPPPVVMIQRAVLPHLLTVALLNDLRRYLSYDTLDDATARFDHLPAVLRCPVREQWEMPPYDGSLPLPGGTLLLTGYQYTAGLELPENADGHVLIRSRAPDARGRHRGVIWSDALSWYSGNGIVFSPGAPPSWAYFHMKRGVRFNGVAMPDSAALEGQHRAWTDGSVEWIDGRMIDLQLQRRDETAPYAVGSGAGSYFTYYWF